jgi:methylglyoxal/glyoxal reductase
MSFSPSVTLNNGIEMPLLGLGIYTPGQKNEVKQAVLWALEMGCRLLDTATIYKNEDEVGQAIIESGIDRKEVFLTTKVWQDDMGFDQTLKAFDQSLKMLQTDYVDLYLLHWPMRDTRKETWKALEQIYASGRAKAIGVCNYYVPHFEELFEYANIIPAVNQTEFHPYCYLPDVLAYCQQRNIQLEGYAPVVRGLKKDDSRLVVIAERYQKSTYQVLVKWALQLGIVTIPKSTNKDRMKENFDVFDFELSIDDMQTLKTFHDNTRIAWDPMDFL